MTLSLHVHGAAGTVTGSCYRLVTPRGTLLVDCGLFQGPKSLRALNYRAFPFVPAEIAAVLFTHAHIDHSGLFPKLTLGGFQGRAFATGATRDLLRWLLPDAGAIQEYDVERLNRRNARRGEPEVVPIYTRADAEASLSFIDAQPYDRWFKPLPGVRARMRNAGHILGSAFFEIEVDAAPRPLRLVFSGDVGPLDKALQPDPARPGRADVALVEATYGNRSREPISEASRRAVLGDELETALAAGGNVVVPVFAVERTQEILEDIAELKRGGKLKGAQVFLDSPLAGRTTEVFRTHRSSLSRSEGGHAFSGGEFRLSESVDQSRAIGRIHGGAIILAGSGMCDAGRVKHHLKDNLWRTDSTILFVGYQAPGTLGALIRGGAAQVRIHGEEIGVKARIRSIESYSGHADREELLAWCRPMMDGLGSLMIVHGEPEAVDGLSDALAASGVDRRSILAPTLDENFVFVHRDGRWRAVPEADGLPRLPPEAANARRDWHNDYAQMLLDIRAALQAAPGDAARHRLLQQLRRALANGSRP
jgi:metallo-beta-lactamase family protein